MMKLIDVLGQKGRVAFTAPETADVATAIRIMHENQVGAVIVPSNSGEPVGVFTERDVMRLCAQGECNFEELLVKDCMTTDLTLGHPDDRVDDVLAIMTEKRFRHMPVVRDGQIIGVISIGDLVKAKLEQTAVEAQALRDYINT